MKRITKVLSLILALMIAASALILVSCSEKKQDPSSDPSVAENKYTITFVMVDDKGESHNYTISTGSDNLREALEGENLISGSETGYGLMVDTVCGIRADYSKDGAYWALYIGENYAMTGVDDTKLTDGGVYKFVYTKG